MIFSFGLIFTVAFTCITCQLTLKRIDAIADLAAVANKYFSKDPNMQYPAPEGKVLNSFAWSVSDMWDQSDSALYVLTRLVNFVDQQDENGELTMAARAIKSFAGQSEARQVYFTTVEASTTAVESYSSVDDEMSEVDGMYAMGREQDADQFVTEKIEKYWNGPEQVIKDIESAAVNRHFRVMAAFIRLGARNQHFKSITSDQKGKIMLSLLGLQEIQLDPLSAKWILTMETFREDQLKLAKETEKNLRTVEKAASPKNELVNILKEVERASGEVPVKASPLKSDYFMVAASESESLYKMAQKQKLQKNLKRQKSQQNEKQTDSKAGREDTEKKDAEEGKEQEIMDKQHAADSTAKTDATSEIKPTDQNYFDEVEAREREIEKGIFNINEVSYYDNDGVYDEQEQQEDKVAWIVITAVIGTIIVTAVGTYIYLRARRARRNRTMLVVTEALETVA